MVLARNLHYSSAVNTVGIAIIACGESYFVYSQKLIEGINSRIRLDGNIRIYLLTDQDFARFRSLSKIEINYIKIPSLRWPEATLFRYRLINKYLARENLTHIFYMDADLEVIDYVEAKDFPLDERIFSVAHPGYYNRGRFFNLVRKVYYPPWETSSKCGCAVGLLRRKVYVAGGFWGGPKEKIIEMCAELEKLIDRDVLLGHYARSYDESYWNWWVAYNREVKILSPIYLFAAEFPWLSHFKRPRILAVSKEQNMVAYKIERDKKYKGENRRRF